MRNLSELGLTECSLNRREFFRKTAVAAACAAAAGAVALPARAEDLTVNGLPATVFGRTGLKVTKISFGGILTTEPTVLMRAIDSGINFVHTSPYYTNGRSIEAFGKVLKTHRQKVVLALKARPEELERWLKVLNTDYADMLVPPLQSVEEINDDSIPESFAKAKKAGMCGFMGYACHSDMANVLNRSRELGWYDVTLMSYADANSPAFLQAAQTAREAGIGIMTMKGLPKRGAEGSTPEEVAQVSSRCTSMVTTEHAHTVLASMNSFQSVDFYHGILETKLGWASPAVEESYWAGQQGAYCSMCDRCSGVCPAGVEVRRILRYRMYQRDYGLVAYARTKYSLLPQGSCAASCTECGLCESVCKRSLPIRRMLSEARVALA